MDAGAALQHPNELPPVNERVVQLHTPAHIGPQSNSSRSPRHVDCRQTLSSNRSCSSAGGAAKQSPALRGAGRWRVTAASFILLPTAEAQEDWTMSEREKYSHGRRILYAAGVGVIALALYVGRSTGETSEIDGFEAAFRSQSKAEALSFIKSFASSHLVGDLIESLPPEVAQQVCADLQGTGPARAQEACRILQEALAVERDLPAIEIAPAAGGAVVDVAPTNADVFADVSADDERKQVQDADDTNTARRTDLSTAPVAVTESPAPIANTSNPADDGPLGEQYAGNPANAGGIDLLYVPAAAVAAAADIATAAPAPVSVSAVTSSESPPPSQGTSDRDRSGGTNVFPETVTANSAARIVAVDPTGTPASAGTPSGSGPDAGRAPSGSTEDSSTQDISAQSIGDQSNSVQSSSKQTSKGKKGSGKKGKGQSSAGQSANADVSGDQSGNGKDGKDKGDKDKGDKGKGPKGDKAGGDKGKGGKGKGPG